MGGEGREVERDGQDMKEASITWRDRWEMAFPPLGSTEVCGDASNTLPNLPKGNTLLNSLGVCHCRGISNNQVL